MEQNFHYGTVTDAINAFKEQGFIIDFNLEENYIVHNNDKLLPDDFEIVDLYRYEGSTDPGDEAVVYAIQSKSGLKGILVTAYGMYSDSASEQIIEKLHYHKK